MPDPATIDPIEAVYRAIAVLVAHGDDAAVIVAGALSRWAALDGDPTFDSAMGLPPGWRLHQRRARRDALLIETAARHWPHAIAIAIASVRRAAAAQRDHGDDAAQTAAL